MTREAIILAGGLGTRLAGVIGQCPKAMAPIGGRPFMEWQLDYLITQNVTRVILSVGFLADQIIAHFGDCYRSIDVVYVREDSPRGTGGALKLALGHIEGHGTFALNGDTLLLADLAPIHGLHGEKLVITVHEALDAMRYGRVMLLEDRVVEFREKSADGAGLVNAGVYWVDRELFSGHSLPRAFSLETDFLAVEAPTLRPRAVLTTDYFVDIGTFEAYARAEATIPETFEHWSASRSIA